MIFLAGNETQLMHITLLLTQLSESASIDQLDVLSQAAAIEKSLRKSGHRTSRLTFTLDLASVKRQLEMLNPDIVFNLVESVDGTDRLMPLATLLLESMRLPFTGSPSHAINTSSGKIVGKHWMQSGDIPTPSHRTADCDQWNGPRPERAIVKSVWEHASFGLSDDSIVRCDSDDDLPVMTLIRNRELETGKRFFAEQFIDGREITLTILAGPEGPEILPPAEILFVDYPDHKPQIVGYAAKWIEDADEYVGTPRTFQFERDDQPLLNRLRELALQCWTHFGMRGYARVDFRIDQDGQPWVLEVNANPCIAPDAGFAAAIKQAGISYDEAVRRILDAAQH